MAAQHHEDTPEAGGRPAGQRAPVSRRAMLRTAAGASAAGLAASGALAALPAAAAARRPAERAGHSASPTIKAQDGTAAGPLVIHVRDARTGEMDIFAGTSHTRLRDPDLAARLTRASQ